MSEYHDIRRCEQAKRLKESLYQVPLKVLECVNPEEKIIISQKYPKQAITIGRQLPPHFKKESVKLLRNNADIFAWEYSDMTGIPRTLKIGSEVFVTEHKLNENKKITPVQQKKRGMALERSAAASKEVEELKLEGATYQRLVDKVFECQIRRNMEAYVDDMIIKSMDEQDMLEDIQEIFKRLQKINMKLNHKMCSFGIEEGQFLGHIVSKRGIKANLTKIQALTSLKWPKTIKEVQSLNGNLAALNRFLSKSVEKSLPFFKTLKGCLEKKDFTWTREADKAFEEMENCIEKLSTLVAPKAGEGLIVYLTASKECISVVLMTERGKDQRPIYFISRVLQGAGLNYPTMEKLVLALIHAARRLKRYFQAHKITIITNKPIRLLLLKPKKSGRVARWAIELEEHKIEFKLRNVIKAQILANFLVETQEEDDETDL
ncbi:reverse transcriptase domain-containing protein [Tanacetum coccineum]